MSLHIGLEEMIETLPKGFRYRVTYDQGAKLGRWRIVAVDKQSRDVFGGAGETLAQAEEMVHTEHERGEWWIKDAERIDV